MLNNDVKQKVLNENNLEKVLEILKPYKGEWGQDIMNHIQKITPNDSIPIYEYGYIRKK